MKRILLVNPPIYDFTAYDFWLKPLGMLTAASKFDSSVDIDLFDFLDRCSPMMRAPSSAGNFPFSRGPFPAKIIDKPEPFKDIPRYFRRFGIERYHFQRHLTVADPYDYVLIQTTMTYWYLGVKEVIDDVRYTHPKAKIVFGGLYASLLGDHAKKIGADIVIHNECLEPLGELVSDSNLFYQSPRWDLYPKLTSAVMTLTRGCPFRCTYCATPQTTGSFSIRSFDHCIADLQLLVSLGVKDVAFYDDSLLFQSEKLFVPFLNYIIENKIEINMHTPNALHARYITFDLARLMVKAGFKTFYIGFESSDEFFQQQTGSKVVSDHLTKAVDNLVMAGADPCHITAYEILGHPDTDLQQLESSIRFVNSLGIRVMLADFSPIPTTPDGERCRKYIDLDEPLNHNKTAFPIILLGDEKVNYFKNLCKSLNRSLQK